MKKLFIILLLLVVVSPALSADRDTIYTVDLRTWVRDYLGGDGTSGKWTDAIIDRSLNLACREYATFVGIPELDTVVTTSGQREYALPADFLRIRGVTRYNTGLVGRERRLIYRALRTSSKDEKGLGEDNDQDHPWYYTIIGVDTLSTTDKGWALKLDPAEEESDRDTLIVYYYGQAIELTADSTISNIPYHAVNLVVISAFRNCLFLNREDPTVTALIPYAEKMYQAYFDLLTREQSDFQFDPRP